MDLSAYPGITEYSADDGRTLVYRYPSGAFSRYFEFEGVPYMRDKSDGCCYVFVRRAVRVRVSCEEYSDVFRKAAGRCGFCLA